MVCPVCFGEKWSPYFSETTDDDLEEAFQICPTCGGKGKVNDPETGQIGECAEAQFYVDMWKRTAQELNNPVLGVALDKAEEFIQRVLYDTQRERAASCSVVEFPGGE